MRTTEQDLGLIALREMEGRADITRDTLQEKITSERALKIVAGIVESGENTPKTQAVLSLLQEYYGSRIQDAYGHDLRLLERNT